MATKKKMLMSSAGAGGAGLDITDVFSTYLYDGTGAAQTITNGIDLDGEGGLVITKRRDSSTGNGPYWNDTERGISSYVRSDSDGGDGAQNTSTGSISSVTSSGYVLGTFNGWNNSSGEYASWTFRKAPKFFDCVTWSGDGVAGREISHNLGTTVGSIFIKQTTGTNNWIVYHRGVNGGVNPEQYNLYLNLTNAQEDFILFNDTAPTDTNFTVGGYAAVNGAGQTYVAYVFAHNDGDGGFGPDNSDIIKCGSFTATGSTQSIDLGWEPQWLLIKSSSNSQSWYLVDVMRGLTYNAGSFNSAQLLYANLSNAESANDVVRPEANGFSLTSSSAFANAGYDYIYMAIRRGPLAQPESGTEVFDVDAYSGNSTAGRTISSGFPVDLAIVQSRSAAGDTNAVADRLRGANLLLNTPTSNPELTNNSDSITGFDFMDGIEIGTDTRVNWSSGTYVSWMWKRAPGYFDVVAYSGNGTGNRGVTHNLGVQPELLIFKTRSLTSGATNWRVTTPDIFPNGLRLNSSGAIQTGVSAFSGCSNPSSTQFFVANADEVNLSGQTYIAYLFSTLAGVSKVGSVSHTSGSATNVDCGFTSGARFILLKVTDSSGSWFVYDTARGIVAGNDARLKLDSTAAENTGNDDIDPLSSGFTITSTVSTGSYIFYAIA